MTDRTNIKVAMAMPRRGSKVSFGAARAFFWAVTSSKACPLNYVDAAPSTLLNHGFDRMWSEALNARDERGVTHFAMLHDDVCPEGVWVEDLVDELERLDADIVSAVVPIKDKRGLTSTAVSYGDIWHRRRITMHEAMRLPETFGSEDVGGQILLNTGCWVCDLRKPWCDEINFGSLERIVKKDGRRVAEVVPEDWLFSHRLHEMLGGAALYATRKVQLTHDGESTHWPNYQAWGQEVDEDYFRIVGQESFPLGQREACTA